MEYDDSLFLYFSKIMTSILNKEIRFLKFYRFLFFKKYDEFWLNQCHTRFETQNDKYERTSQIVNLCMFIIDSF